MMQARNPRLKAIQIGLASGFTSVIDRSLQEWGKQFRISKQAMQQGVDQIRKALGLRKTRVSRSDVGRRAMRHSYKQRKAKAT